MLTKFKIPNYVSEVIYSQYFAGMLSRDKKYNINIDRIKSAIVDLGENGRINQVAELVKDFLKNSNTRNTENFNEKELKFVFMMFLKLSAQFNVYDEYQAGQGFTDLYIQDNTTRKLYEAVVELKYVKKSDVPKTNKEKLVADAKAQLSKYMEDQRLGNKERLKKFAIVFLGFEDYILEEI